MSLSFEIVRRERAERLLDVVPLHASFNDRKRVMPPPWQTPVTLAPAEQTPAGMLEAGSQTEPGSLAVPEPDPQRLEQLRLQARTEGVEEGYAKGLEEGRRQGEAARSQAMAELSGRIGSSVAELERARRQLIGQAQSAIVTLAMAVAEQLARHQISIDPAVPLRVLREVLEDSPQVASVKLSLHPVDRAVVEAGVREMQTAVGEKERSVELIADPSLDRGDVLIATEFGLIDGRISSQVERIRQSFQNVAGSFFAPPTLQLQEPSTPEAIDP